MPVLGGAGICPGWLGGRFFPINKQLRTSSCAVHTAGWAALVLAAFFRAVEIRGRRGAVFPLLAFGNRSIFVSVASGLWVKSMLRFRCTLDGETIGGYACL